jgi:hypothetical protein
MVEVKVSKLKILKRPMFMVCKLNFAEALLATASAPPSSSSE